MKKYSWIVALLIALALAFIACPAPEEEEEEEEEGELEHVVVFDMQVAANGIVPHEIQALPVGPLTFGAGDAGNPIKPLVRAAEDQHADYEIIEADGKKALKYVTHANWGPGFDLRNSVFGFREGDKITVTGTASGDNIDLAFNRNQGGAQQIVGTHVTAEGAFTVEVVLEAADVTAIKGNEQATLRFEDRATTDTTVTITQIVIEGDRPTNVVKLETPVIALSGSTISWTAVTGAGGYKVLALKEGATEATTAATLGAAVVSYNLATSTLAPTVHTDPAVKYSVTLIATGLPGVSTDSDASNAVEYTKQPPAPPPTMKVKVNNVVQNVEVFTAGAGATADLLAAPAEGYSLTYGSGGYGATYAYFEVDFGAGKKLSDYGKLTLKWKGLAGDIANKPILVFVSATEFSGSVAQTNAAASVQFNTPNTSEQSGTFYPNAPAVTSQKAFIAIATWAAATGGTPAVATSYEVYDIAFDSYTPEAVTLLAIPGVDVPIAGASPATSVNSAQYTGTVTWKAGETALDGNFAVSTVYTATITLTAKPPYTLTGVMANTFTVAGATTVTHAANSGVVTAVFPATGAAALTSFPITYSGGTVTGATATVAYTAVTVVNANVTPAVDGYVFAQDGNQYDWSWAKFSINLGDKKLSDFKEVKLTYSFIAGEAGNKRIFLLAATTSDSTFSSGGSTALGWSNETNSSTRSVTRNSTSSDAEGQYANMSPADAANSPKNMTLYIDDSLAAYTALANESQLQIAFYGHMGSGTSYSITNIEFVLK